MKHNKHTSEVVETEDILTATEPEPAAPEKTIGIVSGCQRLNVRAKAYLGAQVLCALDEGTEVEIDESNSTNQFYKVCTATGMDGFCMKQYITVKQ